MAQLSFGRAQGSLAFSWVPNCIHFYGYFCVTKKRNEIFKVKDKEINFLVLLLLTFLPEVVGIWWLSQCCVLGSILNESKGKIIRLMKGLTLGIL